MVVADHSSVPFGRPVLYLSTRSTDAFCFFSAFNISLFGLSFVNSLWSYYLTYVLLTHSYPLGDFTTLVSYCFFIHFIHFVCSYSTPRKKTSLGESLTKSRAYNPIRDSGETFGEREKSCQESCRDSHQESSRDSWRDFSGSPSVSPESRIGLGAWLSSRLVFLREILLNAVASFFGVQI